MAHSTGSDAARRDPAYELVSMELERIHHSRAPSFTSSRDTQSLDDNAGNSSIDHESRPILDVEIDEGFDIPLITQAHHRGSDCSTRASSESVQDALTEHGREPSLETHETALLDTSALEELPTKRVSRQRKNWRKGWRAGVVTASIMTATVLLINVTLTIWASLHFGLDNGIGTAITGHRRTVDNWSTGLHVVINVLSSAMFGASNYTMQCLTAPTRKECDIAHARGDWLDIGIPSVRNLTRIRWPRRIAWTLMALSSIPIHFLYNSAVFKELDNNISTYNTVLVTPEFLQSKKIDFTVFPQPDHEYMDANATYDLRSWYNEPIASQLHNIYREDRTSFDTLSLKQCFEVYNVSILSGHSHLLLVTRPLLTYDHLIVDDDDDSGIYKVWQNWTTIGLTEADAKATPYFWPGVFLNLDGSGRLAHNLEIDYCLAKRTGGQCHLQFSLHILVVVIICNCAKSGLMLWTVWHEPDETFVTFGDALASWLDNPDESTTTNCLMSKSDAYDKAPSREPRDDGYSTSKNRRNSRVRRWGAAVSTKRWVTAMLLCTATICVAAFLLNMAIEGFYDYDHGLSEAISSGGFGAVDPNLILETKLPKGGAGGLVAAVLVVNSPQLILSFCYMLYNGLFTCMHMSQEYSGYATQRKLLRVTTPRGLQRSTYWIQQPYTYGLPLICASGLLHWLISQSIFLARIKPAADMEGAGGEQDTLRLLRYLESRYHPSDIGISIAPILACIILASCMLLTVIGMGFRKLESNMPVAASCSLALTAATHRPKEDVDASVLPVMWGEVPGMGSEDVGHCCFTSQEVVDVLPGRKYI